MESNNLNFEDILPALTWLVAVFIGVVGFRYIRRFIIFILEELYDLFIEHNAEGL